MARGPCTFRLRDLARALKGAHAAGMTVVKAWVERDGKIVLVFADDERPIETSNPWDEVSHEAQRPS